MNANTIKPGATYNFEVRSDVRAEPYRHLRINAVLFADKGPDAGDGDAAEAMRFDRLGGFMEKNRCLGMLRFVGFSDAVARWRRQLAATGVSSATVFSVRLTATRAAGGTSRRQER